MTNKTIKEIEEDMKRLFYKNKEMPPPYSVPVPIGKGIKTGKPRPPSDVTKFSWDLSHNSWA